MASIAPHRGTCFSSLPAELITMIFGSLEYTDLLRCSMVCKCCRNVVEGSAKLRYVIELAIDGLAECCRKQQSTLSDRRQALLDHRSRWRSLNRLKAERLYTGKTSTGILDFSSDVLVQLEFPGLADHAFCKVLLKIISLDKEKPATEETYVTNCIAGVHPDGERFQVEHVLVQPLADLVAIVDCKHILRLEHPGADDDQAVVQAMAIRIHLRSLSTGGRERHPLSGSPIIEHGVELITPDEVEIYKASVDWDLVSVVISNTPGKEFVVWNYLSGSKLVHIRPRPLSIRKTHDFSLVTPASFIAVSSIMISNGTWIDVIELFTIDRVENSKSQETVDGVTLVARLCLPQRGACIAMDVTAGRFSPASPCQRRCETFTPSSESHVYAIRVRSQNGPATGPKLGIVIHRDTFVSILKRFGKEPQRRRFVPWEQWGPQNTRCFELASSCERCPRFVHGERLIWRVKDEGGKFVTQVMDFNSRRGGNEATMSPGRSNSATTAGSESRYVTQPSCVFLPKLYAKPIISSLPYRAIPVLGDNTSGGYTLDTQKILQAPLNPGIEGEMTIQCLTDADGS
ncbi:hypothetical protein DENSPDRAFT_272225 [Dentipellis sp. KUC8613]|nr:hypothetical protein DENSPDRAFT_272225 [Dentipellis sp. KUC8613]